VGARSEAVRALALEAEYSKEEILEAYLNSVYFGHVDGLGLYGVGTAARGYFGKSPERLTLGEAALLAGMIQGPNRLHPERHSERSLARQRSVLERLEELGWAAPEAIRRARRAGLPRLTDPLVSSDVSAQALRWIRGVSEAQSGKSNDGRGVVVETTLDPLLQQQAEAAVERGLAQLRRRYSRLRNERLSAALVTVDSRSGSILAHVGGDPARRADSFDRVRQARRQPGSTVKPFVLLEALDECGPRRPLAVKQRVSNQPLSIQLASGPWSPRNPEGTFSESVDLRQALVESLNVPFVRLAQWCGAEGVAARFRGAGLDPGNNPPPSFVLGSIEVSPLELAAAFGVFANRGVRVEPELVARLERPSGQRFYRRRSSDRRVARATSAEQVRRLLVEAVERGTARPAAIEGRRVFGKTGTSSGRRDAWFVGGEGSVVTVVWVGLDDAGVLGLFGATAAASIWKSYMTTAAMSPVESEPGLRLRFSRRGRATKEVIR
jgi:membrane peptidoglycan carboxypeptidase